MYVSYERREPVWVGTGEPRPTGVRKHTLRRGFCVDGGLYFNPKAFSEPDQVPVSRTLPDVRGPGNMKWDALIRHRASSETP